MLTTPEEVGFMISSFSVTNKDKSQNLTRNIAIEVISSKMLMIGLIAFCGILFIFSNPPARF